MQAADILPIVFWHALHMIVSPPTAEPCVKMEPENIKIKLLFL